MVFVTNRFPLLQPIHQMKVEAQIAAHITMIAHNPSSTPTIPDSSIAYLALVRWCVD